jgi:hypothetical protein
MTTPRAVRYRCELFGRFDPAPAPEQAVRVLELSEHGAFLEEAPGLEALPIGHGGALRLALPGGDPLTLTTRVARYGVSRRELKHPSVENLTIAVCGLGLEFLEVPDEELERLRDFLELLDGR